MIQEAGQFIVLEGGEGAGKTTHALFLAQILRDKGLTVVLTREPGGTPLAEALRDIIVGESGAGLDRLTEMALFMAARHDHVTRCIQPALARGEWVICDRYRDSTYAYQVQGWRAAEQTLTGFEALFQFPDADQTLLFDLPPALGLERAKARGMGGQNRYDRMDIAFHERVRSGFLDRLKQHTARGQAYTVLDAEKPLEDLQHEIRQWVEALMVTIHHPKEG